MPKKLFVGAVERNFLGEQNESIRHRAQQFRFSSTIVRFDNFKLFLWGCVRALVQTNKLQTLKRTEDYNFIVQQLLIYSSQMLGKVGSISRKLFHTNGRYTIK